MIFDERYKHVKAVWLAGELTSLPAFFGIVPKTVVAKDLGISGRTIANRIEDPGKFLLQELLALSEMSGVPLAKMVELAVDHIRSNEKGGTKPPQGICARN